MKTVTRYVTRDGKEFETEAEAKNYEYLLDLDPMIEEFFNKRHPDTRPKARTAMRNTIRRWEVFKLEERPHEDSE